MPDESAGERTRLPALRTRRLGRRPGRDPLERQMVSVFRPVHPHRVTFRVLPFEHGQGEGVLQQALDGPLQGRAPYTGS